MADTILSSAVIIGVSTGVQLARRSIGVTILNDGPQANGASGRSLSWLNPAPMRSETYHCLRRVGIDRHLTWMPCWQKRQGVGGQSDAYGRLDRGRRQAYSLRVRNR